MAQFPLDSPRPTSGLCSTPAAPRYRYEPMEVIIGGRVPAGLLEWDKFRALPRVKVWRISTVSHVVAAGQRLGRVRHVIVARRGVWNPGRNLSWRTIRRRLDHQPALADFLAEDVLVAISHDGQPLTVEHWGPARLIVPHCTHGRAPSEIRAIEFLEREPAGFGSGTLSHAWRPVKESSLAVPGISEQGTSKSAGHRRAVLGAGVAGAAGAGAMLSRAARPLGDNIFVSRRPIARRRANPAHPGSARPRLLCCLAEDKPPS